MLTGIMVVAPPGAGYGDLTTYLQPSDPADPLVIRKVEGLDPVTAMVNTRGYSVAPNIGEFYTGSNVGKRNIIITYGLNVVEGDVSVEEARNIIFGYFPAKDWVVKLRLLFNNRDPVEIDGVVEGTTGDRFSPDPEMQVSIICPKPNFLSELIEILGESDDNPVDSEVLYVGNAGSGMTLELFAEESVDYNGFVSLETRIGSGDYQSMYFPSMFIPAGHKLFVSTHQGLKKAQTLAADGSTSPVSQLEQLDDISYWMQFYAALNLFRVVTAFEDYHLNWRLTYVNQWIGV